MTSFEVEARAADKRTRGRNPILEVTGIHEDVMLNLIGGVPGETIAREANWTPEATAQRAAAAAAPAQDMTVLDHLERLLSFGPNARFFNRELRQNPDVPAGLFLFSPDTIVSSGALPPLWMSDMPKDWTVAVPAEPGEPLIFLESCLRMIEGGARKIDSAPEFRAIWLRTHQLVRDRAAFVDELRRRMAYRPCQDPRAHADLSFAMPAAVLETQCAEFVDWWLRIAQDKLAKSKAGLARRGILVD